MSRRPAVRAPEIYPVKKGEVRNGAVDMMGLLDSGEVMSGTPTIAEFTENKENKVLTASTDLTFSNVKLNTAVITINGQEVPISMGVQFRVDTTNGVVTTRYIAVITAVTNSDPVQTIKREITIDIVQ